MFEQNKKTMEVKIVCFEFFSKFSDLSFRALSILFSPWNLTWNRQNEALKSRITPQIANTAMLFYLIVVAIPNSHLSYTFLIKDIQHLLLLRTTQIQREWYHQNAWILYLDYKLSFVIDFSTGNMYCNMSV